MDLLGITFSETEMWLLGIAGTLIMLLLGVYVPATIKRRQEASSAFVYAFDNVLLNLRENPDCPIAQFAFGFHENHLAAINAFRKHIPFWRRTRFERDVEQYKQAYEVARDYGNVFAVVYSEKTEVAKVKRKIFSEAMSL